MRVHLAAGLLAAALGAGGCYASAGYSTGYSAGYVAPAPAPVYTTDTTATVSVETYQPDLVDVGEGVQVIADYEEPVFYTDNFYWRYNGGTWYRSSVYNGGWTVYNDVPYSVRRIDRPTAYVRYRPSGYVPRARREPYARDRRGYERPAPVYNRPAPAPVVRDHRSYDRGYERPAPAPAPVVRDHRTGGSAPAPAGDYRRDSAPAPATRDHRRDDRRDDRRDSTPTTRDHRR
jgi:hypothetical protein